ncbi:MAG: hypothetical protein ACI9AT_001795, partial [Ulvibacter sp.]
MQSVPIYHSSRVVVGLFNGKIKNHQNCGDRSYEKRN